LRVGDHMPSAAITNRERTVISTPSPASDAVTRKVVST
jgi:hypothetical protein